jgi:glutamate 5-kinase
MNDTKTRIREAKRLVVKVGSAVLARGQGQGFNRPVMAGLARQIAQLRQEGRELVLVSSGAIMAGREALGGQVTAKTIGAKQGLAAVGQVELMRRWTDIFSWYDTHVAQMLLTRDDVSHRRRFLNARRTMAHLLEQGIVPVVNENDSVTVEEIKLGDNDQLSALVTNLVGADLLVLLTEVDGLFTADPRVDPQAEHIAYLEEVTTDIQALAGPPGPEGRGGMASKLEAARRASLFGVPTVIANGRRDGVLRDLAAGHALGTWIAPHKDHLDSRKHWIAFNQNPEGRLVLDEGASRALLHDGRSLLPSGIVEVRGAFEMGDAVELLSADGRVIGRGLTSYNSTEIDRIKGQQSSAVEGILGYKVADEVIHRDHLVMETDQRRLVS